MKAFKFSMVPRTRENNDVFITLNDNIYGIHSKRVNPSMYKRHDVACTSLQRRVNVMSPLKRKFSLSFVIYTVYSLTVDTKLLPKFVLFE